MYNIYNYFISRASRSDAPPIPNTISDVMVEMKNFFLKCPRFHKIRSDADFKTAAYRKVFDSVKKKLYMRTYRKEVKSGSRKSADSALSQSSTATKKATKEKTTKEKPTQEKPTKEQAKSKKDKGVGKKSQQSGQQPGTSKEADETSKDKDHDTSMSSQRSGNCTIESLVESILEYDMDDLSEGETIGTHSTSVLETDEDLERMVEKAELDRSLAF